MDDESPAETGEYEIQRKKAIERNKQFLESLGLTPGLFKEPPKKEKRRPVHPKKTHQPDAECRRSSRIQTQNVVRQSSGVSQLQPLYIRCTACHTCKCILPVDEEAVLFKQCSTCPTKHCSECLGKEWDSINEQLFWSCAICEGRCPCSGCNSLTPAWYGHAHNPDVARRSALRMQLLLDHMFNYKPAKVFLEPVDPAFAPEYLDVISHPMDLGTVRRKLENGEYRTDCDMAADIRLVWNNAMTYNRLTSNIYRLAEHMNVLFESWFLHAQQLELAFLRATASGLHPEDAENLYGITTIYDPTVNFARISRPPPARLPTPSENSSSSRRSRNRPPAAKRPRPEHLDIMILSKRHPEDPSSKEDDLVALCQGGALASGSPVSIEIAGTVHNGVIELPGQIVDALGHEFQSPDDWARSLSSVVGIDGWSMVNTESGTSLRKVRDAFQTQSHEPPKRAVSPSIVPICKKCNQKIRRSVLLRCNSCNVCYHCDCFEDFEFDEAPIGSWYCSAKCGADEEMKCPLCGGWGDACASVVECAGCFRRYHLVCLPQPLSYPPPSSWHCTPECEELSRKKCEDCSGWDDDEHMLLCDQCNRGYHLYCLVPPLQSIPDGPWSCRICRGQTLPARRSRNVSPSGKSSLGEERKKQWLQLQTRTFASGRQGEPSSGLEVESLSQKETDMKGIVENSGGDEKHERSSKNTVLEQPEEVQKDVQNQNEDDFRNQEPESGLRNITEGQDPDISATISTEGLKGIVENYGGVEQHERSSKNTVLEQPEEVQKDVQNRNEDDFRNQEPESGLRNTEGQDPDISATISIRLFETGREDEMDKDSRTDGVRVEESITTVNDECLREEAE